MEQDRGWFLTLAGVLLGFGVLMVHSASITSRPTNFEQIHLSRHLMFLTIGLAAGGLAAMLPPRVWRWLAPLLFILTVGLLVVVLIPGVGTRVKGAQRWLRIGSASLQPSELAKLALPLMLALVLERKRQYLRSWMIGPILFGLPVVVTVPLVLLEPDLGTALFLCFGAAVMLWLAGWPLRNFLAGVAAAVPAVVYLVINKPYQLQRVTGFMATWSDLNRAPYQLQQSLATLGAGGLWGVGLGKGWQKLSFLPEANTDFVFAVIGEELGLLGTLSVVLLWAGLLFFGWRLISALPRGSFERNVAATLLLQIVFQAALNIAVVTALVPPKGISHPLISCGGSNLVVSLTALGLIVGLADPRRALPMPEIVLAPRVRAPSPPPRREGNRPVPAPHTVSPSTSAVEPTPTTGSATPKKPTRRRSPKTPKVTEPVAAAAAATEVVADREPAVTPELASRPDVGDTASTSEDHEVPAVSPAAKSD